jgi:hypothetical protein
MQYLRILREIHEGMACQPRFLNFECPRNADVYVSTPLLFLRLYVAHYHPNIRAEVFLADDGHVLGTFNDLQGLVLFSEWMSTMTRLV